MPTGSELVETWLPDGGFKVERRRIATPNGATFTECLVPKWQFGELTQDQPCARQPCLHRIAAGDRRGEEMLERKLAAGLARASFHLTAIRENGSGFRMRYRPATLRTALWQRLAGEVAGLLQCARCPAPRCGRWFLKTNASRSDRQFCSDTCRVRAFRRNGKTPQG